jgi:hypothetical protein
LTVVTPVGKVEPDAGVQVAEKPVQLSSAVSDQVTFALLHWPVSVLPAMLSGHVMVGFSVSLIVTLKEHVAVWPEASVAVQFTVLTPLGKVEPETGLHAAVTPGQLSEAVGSAHVKLALLHWPGSVLRTMFPGQLMVGFSASLITTGNEQLAVFPAASMAVQRTVLEPTGNVEPEGGAQDAESPVQLSDTWGGSQTTLALEH